MRVTGVVLLYHRVADEADDPLELAVSRQHFDEHMAVVRRVGRPCSLAAMVAGARAGRVPRRSMAVTFDDGYADVATNAAPILERHGIPATAYLTAAMIGTDECFWWDRLASAVLDPPRLPDALELVVGGRAHQWHVTDHDEADRWEHSRRWLLQALQAVLRPLRTGESVALVAQVERWAGRTPAPPGARRTLTEAEVRDLADGGLVDIGAHTMTHPQLSAIDPDEQADEIVRSKQRLEAMVGRPVTTFAYPYGDRADYDAGSVRCVREAGFTSACANVVGRVSRRSDPFALPRVHVSDCDGDGLLARLRRIEGA